MQHFSSTAACTIHGLIPASTRWPTENGTMCSGVGALINQEEFWPVTPTTLVLGARWITTFHKPITVPNLQSVGDSGQMLENGMEHV